VILPVALAIMDAQMHPGAAWTARLRRLAPAVAALALALGLSVLVRATWPPGTALRIWSPAQFAGAWRLPLDFARTLVPPDTGTGIARALGSQPVWVALAALFAALAVPPAAWARAGGSIASGPGPGARPVVVFGLAVVVLGMLPVGVVIERWRGDFFSLSAVGGALALGALLAAIPAAIPRALLAIAAMVNFGAGGIYRPIEPAAGPAQHPHVNYAFFRETAGLSDGLLAALAPWCGSIRALPRTFVAGVPPDQVFETALGPGLRVTCADTVERVRFLAEFTPADARTDFGVLRFDPRSVRFMHERADARVRARVGEGFLIHARYDVAAACFEAAAGEASDRELSYPLAASLAAAGRAAESRAAWQAAVARGAALDPDTMVHRMEAAAPGAAATLRPLAAAVLREPWLGPAHAALGRALLGLGRGREATFELAVAAGIGRGNQDLAWLAQGYEAMGLVDEALIAYRRALETGLPADLYATTRDRFFALQRRTGVELDRPRSGP
jgi:tetratricopeptide (TPR) repeat protein